METCLFQKVNHVPSPTPSCASWQDVAERTERVYREVVIPSTAWAISYMISRRLMEIGGFSWFSLRCCESADDNDLSVSHCSVSQSVPMTRSDNGIPLAGSPNAGQGSRAAVYSNYVVRC